MVKIAIVGPTGAGKTTLAKKLSSTYKIKAFHLDRLFWQRDWKKETRDNRIDILQQLIQEKQWIIEGTYIHSTELHLIAADTIIFLDVPSLVCLLRLIKRYCKGHGRPRRDIPEGCRDKLTMYRILKVLSFPLRERKTLTQKLSDFETKEIVWFRSKKEIEDFLWSKC
jgi:adenylate kinase family enzyme